MAALRHTIFLCLSICFHILILLVLVLGFDFSLPLVVIENTNKTDVISAVVLGDTPKSQILPDKPVPAPEVKSEKETKPPPEKAKAPVVVKKDAIPLATDKKKKDKDKEKFAKELLADIAKHSRKHQKEQQQKRLQTHFEKTLKEHAEKTLRQQLLDEQIQLQSKQLREAQGVINKYIALITQAISENWLIPLQSDKRLYCELMIRLGPSGTVLDVQVTRSSGDPALDKSARDAVLKASPLPVPKEPKAFAAFREFLLKVRPKDVIANKEHKQLLSQN